MASDSSRASVSTGTLKKRREEKKKAEMAKELVKILKVCPNK